MILCGQMTSWPLLRTALGNSFTDSKLCSVFARFQLKVRKCFIEIIMSVEYAVKNGSVSDIKETCLCNIDACRLLLIGSYDVIPLHRHTLMTSI